MVIQRQSKLRWPRWDHAGLVASILLLGCVEGLTASILMLGCGQGLSAYLPAWEHVGLAGDYLLAPLATAVIKQGSKQLKYIDKPHPDINTSLIEQQLTGNILHNTWLNKLLKENKLSKL